jgi:outer membrane lipoprotein SlyB
MVSIMPRFQVKNSLNDRLNRASVQVHVGDRPSASRPAARFAAVVLVAAAALSATPSAHASWLSDTLTGKRVPATNTEHAEPVSVGVIRQVHSVDIGASQSGLNAGNAVGAVGGGLVGSLVGGGKGRILAIAAGALGGGKIGGDIQRNSTHTPGYEIVVEIADGAGGPYARGQMVVITQPADVKFYPNDVVYVTGNQYHAPRIQSFQSKDNVAISRPASEQNGAGQQVGVDINAIGQRPGGINGVNNGVVNGQPVGSVNAQFANPTTSVNQTYRRTGP